MVGNSSRKFFQVSPSFGANSFVLHSLLYLGCSMNLQVLKHGTRSFLSHTLPQPLHRHFAASLQARMCGLSVFRFVFLTPPPAAAGEFGVRLRLDTVSCSCCTMLSKAAAVVSLLAVVSV